jgi:hypothetical protein
MTNAEAGTTVARSPTHGDFSLYKVPSSKTWATCAKVARLEVGSLYIATDISKILSNLKEIV